MCDEITAAENERYLAEVDTGRGVGVTGYCMGERLMMRTAAAAPGRVRAGVAAIASQGCGP